RGNRGPSTEQNTTGCWQPGPTRNQQPATSYFFSKLNVQSPTTFLMRLVPPFQPPPSGTVKETVRLVSDTVYSIRISLVLPGSRMIWLSLLVPNTQGPERGQGLGSGLRPEKL